MKINFPNGIIAEGTVSECELLLSNQKKKVEVVAPARKIITYRRKPWTGKELSIVFSTLDLPVSQAINRLPGRNRASLWAVREDMKKNKLRDSLRKKLDIYRSEQNQEKSLAFQG